MENILLFLYQLRTECDNNKTITHKVRFISSFRFMNVSL